MRAFNQVLQILILVGMAFWTVQSVITLIPHLQLSEGYPGSLVDRFETSRLQESADEAKRYELNETETELLLSGAGLIIALLFTNFVFGRYTHVDKFAYITAILAFFFALLSSWFGFRVINELKWLVMFEISSSYWLESRLNVFHVLQTAIFLYLALPLTGIFILRVINSKLPESE